MSFFKDVYNDFTRQEPMDADKVKNQAWFFLLTSLFLFTVFISEAIIENWDTITFYQVIPTQREETTQKVDIALPFGTYTTGKEGVLIYRSTSVLDKLLFHNMSSLNILDFSFFLFMGIILFNALRNVDEQFAFREKISNAYKKMAVGCIWMFMLKMLYSIFILRKYFAHITDGQFYFSQQTDGIGHFLYMILGGIILSFVYFMNKGVELQQEKDLTI